MIVSRESLKQALHIVGACDRGEIAPRNSGADLSAWTRDLLVRVSLPDMNEGGTTTETIPVQRLAECVDLADASEVRLEQDGDRDALRVEAGKCKWVLRRPAALVQEARPETPAEEAAAEIVFGAEGFWEVMRMADHARARDELRPALAGVCIMSGLVDGKLRVLATDTYRAFEAYLDTREARLTEAVPEKIILGGGLLARALACHRAKDTDTVRLRVWQTQAEISGHDGREQWACLGPLVEGAYANVDAVLYPEKAGREALPPVMATITVDAARLQEALRQCHVVARGDNGRVAFEVVEGELRLSAGSADAGDAQASVGEIVVEGELPADMRWAQRADWLAGFVGWCEGQVKLEVRGALLLMFFRPEPGRHEAVYVQMPMQLG